MPREQDFYSEHRANVRKVLEGINGLVAGQREYNALDYGNTLEPGAGENDGVTKVEIGAVVFDTANALVAVLNAGHATNMYKVL